jgi:pimeloyl-ACP methyl ester carboxylesterase
LVAGRERIYFEHFWNDFAADGERSLSEEDRVAFTAAYARPGRMRAGWEYFVSFLQAAEDFAEFSKTKLPMPVLVIAGEKASGNTLDGQFRVGALDVTTVILKGTGHWLIDENRDGTLDALVGFL